MSSGKSLIEYLFKCANNKKRKVKVISPYKANSELLFPIRQILSKVQLCDMSDCHSTLH